MKDEILKLKMLNASYIAALEYDRCPSSEDADEVDGLFETGVSLEQLQDALEENSGRRPDEIASDMSYLIKQL